MRIALVSEHANPLATVGSVDAGGQNVHVAALAGGLVARGHEVTVFSRRDNTSTPVQVTAPEGYVVEHVPAGPPTDVPKDELLPCMPAFAGYLERRWRQEAFDVVHAHFWMSGLASVEAARYSDLPVLQTFHALGTVKKRNQGSHDTSPPARIGLERRLVRQVDRGDRDLHRRGEGAAGDRHAAPTRRRHPLRRGHRRVPAAAGAPH